MVNIEFTEQFKKDVKKIKDELLKKKVKKQIEKIVSSPEIGKPLRYERKETRETYITPYRLAYSYNKNDDKIIFLALYHKDEQ
ncbi:MAG: type II toxin-antitoxin system RelE family toxin [Candidatus Nanoarchaeia archaeon]